MSIAQVKCSTERFSLRLVDVAAVALFLAVVSALSWRVFENRAGVGPPTPDRWGLADYRDVIYFPLIALGDGVNPYDSVRSENPQRYMNRYPVVNHFPLYSPLVLVVFAPLSLLSVEGSMAAFAALNAALFVLLAWITLRAVGLGPTIAGVFGLAALLLASQPGRSAFNSGQISLPLALATLGALEWGDRRYWFSTVMIALSTIKPTFGGPLGLLLAARHDSRKSALSGLAIGGLLFVIGVAAIFAWTDGLSADHLTNVITANHTHFSHDPEAVPQTNKARNDLAASAEYLVGQPLPRWLPVAITVFVLGISSWVLWRQQLGSQSPVSTTSAFIILAMFVCIYHNVYELPLLVVPLAACATAADPSWKNMTAARRNLLIVLLVVPFVNIFWTKGFRWGLDSAGIPWGDGNGVVREGLFRLACAANGLAMTAAWLILALHLSKTPSNATNRISPEGGAQ